MRAKPDMKPWVHTDKSRSSSAGEALQREHLPYVSEVPPLKGLNECVPIINPGLAPWAMKKYRPYRALCDNTPINVSTRPPDGLPKDKFYLFFGEALQNAIIARH